MKVSKFGGSSLADASQVMKVVRIVKADSDRQIIVVSAPGKRSSEDHKVTDLLYEWHRIAQLGLSGAEVREIITLRFQGIVRELGLEHDVCIDTEMETIARCMSTGTAAYAASRGEFLSGKIVAAALGFTFIGAGRCIRFDENGKYHRHDQLIRDVIGDQRVVIPGFYGRELNGSKVRTFSRGGSDLTGAIIARAMEAEVYENWTDVSGLLKADPRIVHNPAEIKTVTYPELRELSYMGANVFHEEAMFPVQEAKIPTNIRNTNNPDHPGTIISFGQTANENEVVTGIAGKKGFTVITLEKILMNQEIGFVRKVLTVLEENSISFEHVPGGIDSLSVIIEDKFLDGKTDHVVAEIKKAVSPDSIKVLTDMAMIAIVGHGMAFTPGIAAKIFGAVAEKGINVKMINQGASELSIIIGVDDTDYENAIRAIYASFA